MTGACRRLPLYGILIPLLALLAPLDPTADAQPNPYRTLEQWLSQPPGRTLGSASTVDADANGDLWIAERCGANSCADHPDIDPILLYSPSGRWIKSFGAGLFAWPHGIYVDADGHVWVTDARAGGGHGHQVLEFSPDGKILLALGEAGVAGSGPAHFNGPTDVVVAPNGDVFVTDGHEDESNNRVVKFSRDGRFIKDMGRHGHGSRPVPRAARHRARFARTRLRRRSRQQSDSDLRPRRAFSGCVDPVRPAERPLYRTG